MKSPANGVRTPLELAIALLVKAPQVGSDPNKAPLILQIPSASISCVASTTEPAAKKKFNLNKMCRIKYSERNAFVLGILRLTESLNGGHAR